MFFKRFYLFFRQKGREGERGRETLMCERYIDWLTLVHPQTEPCACNPGIYPDWESNWQPFGLQAGAQPTEPHQPELYS